MKPTDDELIAIYSKSLARYEADGDPMAGPTRAMIDALKATGSAKRSPQGEGSQGG